MPRARNRFERCRQVLRWLESEYPCGRKISIRWHPELRDKTGEWDAHTVRNGRALEIHMSSRKCPTWTTAVDTLIHEYAHALLWGVSQQESSDESTHHPPEFWAAYGRISDRFHHDHGAEESCEYDLTA